MFFPLFSCSNYVNAAHKSTHYLATSSPLPEDLATTNFRIFVTLAVYFSGEGGGDLFKNNFNTF